VEYNRMHEESSVTRQTKGGDGSASHAESGNSLLSRLATHPLRAELIDEVHARPSPLVSSPIRVSHMVFLDDERAQEAIHEHICKLARRFDASLPVASVDCYYEKIGGLELRWERHTEFCSYTFIRQGEGSPPFGATALDMVPEDWIEEVPGVFLSGVHAAIRSGPPPDPFGSELSDWFDGYGIYGSHIVDNKAAVWTSFKAHQDGFGRILVCDLDLSDFQVGRTLQRLLEMDTYRILALLSLPRARDIAPRAARLDRQLAAAMDEFSGLSGVTDERRLLDELTILAATVEQYRSDTNYRFAATRAYHSLVMRTFTNLGEEKFPGMSTMTKFLERRFLPAMRTCQAVEDQLESLSQRISRATDLLRARVDVAVESQNQKLLSEMNRRSQLQLRLQQTVEGLSVAAISYYLVGLIKYALEAGYAAGWQINPKLGTGIAAPIVVVSVWWLIRRVRTRLSDEGKAAG
jgi:uncharacterized membrane-anchored protein